jgi:uncharacterized lipoprotein YddW (UPF0748 family)
MKIQKFLLFLGMIHLLVSCTATTRIEAPVKEARAVWYSRFEYCNYTRTHDQDSIKQHIIQTINKAADANFNIIIFQIRGNGDAYYKSDIEPWGELLTGEFGKDPGWDPLEFAIDVAHGRGLELHAWINTFPAWRGKNPPPETVPLSPYLAHPEWLVCDSSGTPQPLTSHYVSFSPGVPAVHDYLINLAVDVIRRYDIDGIHFDYIRYPEGSVDRGYSHDAISVERFNNSETCNRFNFDWEDWQREQLNQFVYKMYNAVHNADPAIKMSTATIGSYQEGAWTAYHAVYQDGRRWAEMGKVDFIAPMIYWERSHPTQPFLPRSLEWQKNAYDRYSFPGLGSYRYNTDKDPHTWDETLGQIRDLRDLGFKGMVFFDAGSLEKHWKTIGRKEFATPSNIPPMPWLDVPEPVRPTDITVEFLEKDRILVSWKNPDESCIAHRYNIFISDTENPDSTSSKHLRMVTKIGETSAELQLKTSDKYLFMSSLNKAWVESPLSDMIELID